MSQEDDHRKRAEALLSAAAATDNMKMRSALLGEASYWHNLAMEAHEGHSERYPISDEDADEART